MISMEADANLGLNSPKGSSKGAAKPKAKKQQLTGSSGSLYSTSSTYATKPKATASTSLTSSKSPSLSSKSPSLTTKSPSLSTKTTSSAMPAPSSSSSTAKKSGKRPVIYTTEEEDEEIKRNLSEESSKGKSVSFGEDDDDDFGWDSLDSDEPFKTSSSPTPAKTSTPTTPTATTKKTTTKKTQTTAAAATKPKSKTVKSKASQTSATSTYKYNSADQLHKKPIPKSERTFVPVEDTSSSSSTGPKQYKNAQGRVVAMSYDGGVGGGSSSYSSSSSTGGYRYNSADQLHKKPIPRSQRTFVPADNQSFTPSSSRNGAYELRNASGRVVAMSYDGGAGNTGSSGGYNGGGLIEQGWERLSSLAKNVASTTQKTIHDSGIIDGVKKMSTNLHNYMLSEYSREQNGINSQSLSYQNQGRWNGGYGGGVEIKTKTKKSDWDFCKEYSDDVTGDVMDDNDDMWDKPKTKKAGQKGKKKVVVEEEEEEEEEEVNDVVPDNDIDELDELFSHDAEINDEQEQEPEEEEKKEEEKEEKEEKEEEEGENGSDVKSENIVEGEEEEGEEVESENVQGDVVDGEEEEEEEVKEEEVKEEVKKEEKVEEEEVAVTVPTPTKKEKKQKVVRIIEDVDSLSPPLN